MYLITSFSFRLQWPSLFSRQNFWPSPLSPSLHISSTCTRAALILKIAIQLWPNLGSTAIFDIRISESPKTFLLKIPRSPSVFTWANWKMICIYAVLFPQTCRYRRCVHLSSLWPNKFKKESQPLRLLLPQGACTWEMLNISRSCCGQQIHAEAGGSTPTADHQDRLAASLISRAGHKRRYLLHVSGQYKRFLVWCPSISDPHMEVPIGFMHYQDGLALTEESGFCSWNRT